MFINGHEKLKDELNVVHIMNILYILKNYQFEMEQNIEEDLAEAND